MFRFTIRDVLWLTVVVALGVGWWIDHLEQSAKIRNAKEPDPFQYRWEAGLTREPSPINKHYSPKGRGDFLTSALPETAAGGRRAWSGRCQMCR